VRIPPRCPSGSPTICVGPPNGGPTRRHHRLRRRPRGFGTVPGELTPPSGDPAGRLGTGNRFRAPTGASVRAVRAVAGPRASLGALKGAPPRGIR
jgi:hypothetical protein